MTIFVMVILDESSDDGDNNNAYRLCMVIDLEIQQNN